MILNERPRDKAGRFTRKTKYKTLLGITFTLIIVSGALWGLVQLLNWHDDHVVKYHRVLTVQTHRPITIEKREVMKVVVETQVFDIEVDTPVEQMICETFGQWECKTALAVAYAESGMREDAWNSNTNGTLDIGLFQVNSVHWDKEGCALADLVTAEGNIKCAKQIFDESGWGAWSVVNNGSVGAHL